MKITQENLRIEIGDEIVLGKKYCLKKGINYTAKKLKIIEGVFDNDNGLYCYEETAPSVKNEDIYNECDWDYEEGEYESVYHLFGEFLDGMLDTLVIKKEAKSIYLI